MSHPFASEKRIEAVRVERVCAECGHPIKVGSPAVKSVRVDGRHRRCRLATRSRLVPASRPPQHLEPA